MNNTPKPDAIKHTVTAVAWSVGGKLAWSIGPALLGGVYTLAQHIAQNHAVELIAFTILYALGVLWWWHDDQARSTGCGPGLSP